MTPNATGVGLAIMPPAPHDRRVRRTTMKHCKDCAHFSGTVWCRAALVIGREAKKACVTKAALPKAVEPVTNRLTVERPARGVTVYTHRLGG